MIKRKQEAKRADDSSKFSFCFSQFLRASIKFDFFFVSAMLSLSLQDLYNCPDMLSEVTLAIMCGNRWKESLAAVLRKTIYF